MAKPEFWLIAGPNGAGKTTLACSGAIPKHVLRLNPDEVTLRLLRGQGINSFQDAPAPLLRELNIAAAESVFSEVSNRLGKNQAVAVETVLSTDKYRSVVAEVLKRKGRFNFIYVALSSPRVSLIRVRNRVRMGGHDVPSEKLKGRWQRSLDNLPAFAALASNFWIFDNSDSDELISPPLIATGGRGLLITLLPDINRPATRALVESPLFSHKVAL